MFEVGKTYVSLHENAGKTVILPYGRKIYTGKEITVLSDEGPIGGVGTVHCYKVINDRGEIGMVDGEDFPMFSEVAGEKERKGFFKGIYDFVGRFCGRFAWKKSGIGKRDDKILHRQREYKYMEEELKERKNWKPRRDRFFVPAGWDNGSDAE